MRIIGFSKQEEYHVYNLISSILLVGNVSFEERNDVSFVENQEGNSIQQYEYDDSLV